MSQKGPKLLDSSIWIEIFGSGKLKGKCEKHLLEASEIIVPTLILFEVYKKIAILVGETEALSVIGLMSQYQIVDLSPSVALSAADLSIESGLAMADSMVLAHARSAKAELVTLDNDFSKIKSVTVVR